MQENIMRPWIFDFEAYKRNKQRSTIWATYANNYAIFRIFSHLFRYFLLFGKRIFLFCI